MEGNALIALESSGLMLVGGSLGAVITSYMSRKKTSADAESTLSQATLNFAKTLRDDINSLRTLLEHSEGRARDLERNLQDARVQFEQADKKSRQLEEVLALHDKRAAEMKLLIAKLSEALRKYEPENPLMARLAQL